MKKQWSFFLVLCFLFASAPLAAAETDEGHGFWFEAQTASGTTGLLASYERAVAGPFGIYVHAYASTDKYRNAYVGPTVKLADWLTVGVGIGRENQPYGVRKNAFFEANVDKVYAYGTFEKGASGPWHKVILMYKVSEKIGLGVMEETFIGRGPRLEYNISDSLQVVAAFLRDEKSEEKKSNAVFAVNYAF